MSQKGVRSDHVKCVFCGGNHPANYKGCSVYRELQKAKFPPLRPRVTVTTNPTIAINPTTSYADITGRKNNNNDLNHNHIPQSNLQSHTNCGQNLLYPNTIKELKETLQTLMSHMATIANTVAELLSKLNQNSTS